ncbi:uncharacterized protein LOC114360340 [Ostrinia furnacalis]|uniref:uncharacterized protein LOC114360340 n=1 Tax=Ostrinia furnacalis TaxID=93504 RepID=UPI001039DD89|nr:uncharacterized protein LOC114360340 [Ostrinia furnacalis]
MKSRLLLALCFVLLLSDGALSEGEHDIKRGVYPFMAFLYYPDENVVEATGERFLRGAVLVKPEWLVSSTVGSMVVNGVPLGFPRKTLMARLGTVSIDTNFTLNEDEDEQEREVIQIVRPHNHSATQWWQDDISLLKTLLPFNVTTAVAIATIRSKPVDVSSTCFILVFAKRYSNSTEEKLLMQLYVDPLPASIENCGQHFSEATMLCANDSDENKNAVYDPEFCQGNSGGPLVCENEVAGIQTYIENNCKQPHLYQLLSTRDNFITCGIEDKCNEENCGNMCMLINKDDPIVDEPTTPAVMNLVSAEVTTVTEEITIPVHTSSESTDDDEVSTQLPTLTAATLKRITVDTTTTTAATTIVTTTTTTTSEPSTSITSEETEEVSWPKEKYPERMKGFEEEENKIERKTSVEAQRQDVKVKAKRSGAAERNLCLFQSVFSLLILANLM